MITQKLLFSVLLIAFIPETVPGTSAQTHKQRLGERCSTEDANFLCDSTASCRGGTCQCFGNKKPAENGIECVNFRCKNSEECRRLVDPNMVCDAVRGSCECPKDGWLRVEGVCKKDDYTEGATKILTAPWFIGLMIGIVLISLGLFWIYYRRRQAFLKKIRVINVVVERQA